VDYGPNAHVVDRFKLLVSHLCDSDRTLLERRQKRCGTPSAPSGHDDSRDVRRGQCVNARALNRARHGRHRQPAGVAVGPLSRETKRRQMDRGTLKQTGQMRPVTKKKESGWMPSAVHSSIIVQCSASAIRLNYYGEQIGRRRVETIVLGPKRMLPG
ncbi:hypothetical protein CCMA1212_001019, partial [Trichoderma ghanense]